MIHIERVYDCYCIDGKTSSCSKVFTNQHVKLLSVFINTLLYSNYNYIRAPITRLSKFRIVDNPDSSRAEKIRLIRRKMLDTIIAI